MRRNIDEHDPDQAWYWTPEWQEIERKAEEDIKAGRVETFDNGEDLLNAINKFLGEPNDGKLSNCAE